MTEMTETTEPAGQDHGMSRRRLMRSALLMGAGAVAVSAASVALPGTAQAATAGSQTNWAYCTRCKGIFWATLSFGNNGYCPTANDLIETHERGATNYTLEYGYANTPTRQEGWRYCNLCAALFWGPEQANSVCPTGGRSFDGHHNIGSATQYDMYFSLSAGLGFQIGWTFCWRCKGMYWGDGANPNGKCPAWNGSHQPGSTTIYDMKYT